VVEPSVEPGAKGAKKRRSGVLGWWSALIFNLGLLGLPIGLVMLVVAMEGVELARFEASPASLAQARGALERMAAGLAPREAPRSDVLNALFSREVAEGDVEAARGVLMSAGAVLPGPESARLFQRLKAGHSDDDLAAAALRFVEPDVASRFLGLQGGAPRGEAGGAYFIVGDDRELATLARRWLNTGRSDATALILSGLTVADLGLSAAETEQVRIGASILKSATSAGRLGPELSDALGEALAAIAPAELLGVSLDSALAAPGALADEGAAVKQAFAAAISPAALKRFVPRFSALRGVVAHTSPAGALHLIKQARAPTDFARLELLAQAGRERAVLVAKRTTRPAAFLDAAPATWRAPSGVLSALAVLGLAFAALVLATVLVLKHAVERTIDGGQATVGSTAPRLSQTRRLAKPAKSPPEAVS
jgi:hypothetical protein